MEKQLKLISITLFTLVVASCGGGSGDSGTDFEISPGGVWTTPSVGFEAFISTELVEFPDDLEPSEFIIDGNSFFPLEDPPSLFASGLREQDIFLITESGQVVFRSSIPLDSITGVGSGFVVSLEGFSSMSGTGQITQSNSDGVEAEFRVEASFFEEGISADGAITPILQTLSGDCQATGSLIERVSLSLSLDCSSDDGSIQETFDFDLVATQDCSDIACSNSETVYETAFALDDIVGTYNLEPVAALDFVSNREIVGEGDFEAFLSLPPTTPAESINQIEISPSGNISGLRATIIDGQTTFSCEMNGEVSIIEEGFNLFNFSLTTENCVAPELEPISDSSSVGDGSVLIPTSTPINFLRGGLMTVRAFEDRIFLQLLSQLQLEEEIEIPNFVSTTIYERVPESP